MIADENDIAKREEATNEIVEAGPSPVVAFYATDPFFAGLEGSTFTQAEWGRKLGAILMSEATEPGTFISASRELRAIAKDKAEAAGMCGKVKQSVVTQTADGQQVLQSVSTNKLMESMKERNDGKDGNGYQAQIFDAVAPTGSEGLNARAVPESPDQRTEQPEPSPTDDN